MRPFTRRFTWGEDEDTGRTGWMMKGFEGLDPTQGFGVAHDTLEHFDLKRGMNAEMHAFGCMVYGRGDTGWWKQRNWPSFLADDVEEFLRGGAEWCDPLKQKHLPDEHTWADVYIGQIGDGIAKALKLGSEDHDREPLEWEHARGYADDMVQWMRYGFLRACKRWDSVGGSAALITMFDRIAEHPLTNQPYEGGDELRIRVYPERCLVELDLMDYD